MLFGNEFCGVCSYSKNSGGHFIRPRINKNRSNSCRIHSIQNKKTGETVVLLFHESLFHGNKLDHSLMNPNQIRHYGISVWDNPFDKERSFGIGVDSETFIPFCTIGTKIYFNTRTPSKKEMEICRTITMTSPEEWVTE